MKNFVTTYWLKKHIEDANLIIVDCRGDLLDENYGRRVYEQGHLKGAKFINLSKQLSSAAGEHGGRNPLPEIDDFKNTIEGLGINNDTVVVAYDEYKIAGAARFCWMLRHIGHQCNYVLDGGIDKWISDENDISTDELEVSKKGDFKISINENLKTNMKHINEVKLNPETLVIDSRTEIRYSGKNEPIDKIAGHIKGALNYYWKDNLNDDNTIKDISYLKERFKNSFGKKEVIVYCGSGIDAAFNFLALDEIDVKAKLYVGSWSDWITYKKNI
ncbi:sulfurtransferase [Clostridium carboxidivorans P7]|uniref:3-mercaptopyruvate sulfurtransferase n=1 Tax=Clostridium carboxidivorans P7 TaxID=536227 RepID=C6PSU2_9CLOT|nr:sulfurtransferase [Clostridium carboxidivorans]AKN30287.1 sulfurtransferase [Clostridium carboxidivorans P7]EET87681.1 3-mercaptopyruvate sulfurtransferase [Clostridium carboxidivorans P7]